ncbi:TonB-dependent receptor [Flavobacterium franklandianum]|uniref:TonB-dependent receptor n=1 Tax=Flavobacterium franklandianum TaxID=2594430 RepID=A0A553CTT2_9FLAO|nr:TonB-dependent receptor [Flavobacterium franklandianum]TRX23865.1 TonB-dependent receptor [Flavobacterium franklandianum]TRX27949.1 TonB-dependent receptor [Flavobacterium franklandianum]
MKTIKNWVLSGLLFMVVSTVFSQGKITGTITDGQSSLPGTNVAVKGSKIGASTDFDGKFMINTTANSGELVISFIGYDAKTVKFTVANGGTTNLGTIVLTATSNELSEVVVRSGVVDLAKDRKTPVAVSTIKASEIQEKLGTQEFPEILANTPSVYVTKAGGGFGDSRINIRGFDQRNVAVMINGVPVNDMENGAVYWSNWAGLSDVTSAMQVQRGLGSSKLAISSVGGTINVITRTSDMKEGGAVSTGFGNANYLKVQGSYNTGIMKNGFSASVLLSSTTGNGYADGTQFQGKNYFIAFGYKPNDKHDIQFTFTGAPQWHNQRSFANTISDYLKYGSNGEPNIKYSSDWGYKNGEQYAWTRNFYHKPVMSFNWDYKISEKSKLSSVAYASWGRGGGTGNIGKSPFSYKTADGLVPFDDFVAFNTGTYTFAKGESLTNLGTPLKPSTIAGHEGEYITNRSTGFTRRASINSHDWYGAVIDFNTKLSEKLILDLGIDARTYTGYHFRNINDRLGADVYYDNVNVNNKPAGRYLYETYSASPSFNPWTDVKNQEKIEYNNNGYVRWYGAFTQLEYSTEKLSAFFQGSVSQQGFKREDTFIYLTTDPLYVTDYENILGGNVKGGINYNINEQQNVFINSGYYSKQPNFQAVYPNNKSIVGENLTNEKILGLEAGYGFRSRMFNAKLNLYYTSWKDRYQRATDAAADNVGGYYDYTGITEIHSGIELEMNAKPLPKLNINAMISVGDWTYNGNSISNRYDANNEPVGGAAKTLYLDNLKVGDAAQTTASLGASYEVVTRVFLDANYRVAQKLYASIDPSKFTSEVNDGTLELPSYGLMDAGFSYKMLVGKNKSDSVNFRLNVNNVLDEVYISESRTNNFTTPTSKNYNGVNVTNQVYFGFGRTWNFSLRYNF